MESLIHSYPLLMPSTHSLPRSASCLLEIRTASINLLLPSQLIAIILYHLPYPLYSNTLQCTARLLAALIKYVLAFVASVHPPRIPLISLHPFAPPL